MMMLRYGCHVSVVVRGLSVRARTDFLHVISYNYLSQIGDNIIAGRGASAKIGVARFVGLVDVRSIFASIPMPASVVA